MGRVGIKKTEIEKGTGQSHPRSPGIMPRRGSSIQLTRSLKRDYFDWVIHSVAFLGPLTGLPQVISIWGRNSSDGVSLSSWSLFMALSVLWFIHALRRKDRALAVSSALWVVVDAAIILGGLRAAS